MKYLAAILCLTLAACVPKAIIVDPIAPAVATARADVLAPATTGDTALARIVGGLIITAFTFLPFFDSTRVLLARVSDRIILKP